MSAPRIAIVVSHPIQHFVPMYASLAASARFDVKVFFASSIGFKPYFDERFGKTVQWDNLRLDAVPHLFLDGGAAVAVTNAIDSPDLERELESYAPDAVIVYGYIQRLQRRAKRWALRNGKKIFYIADTERKQRRPWYREAVKYLWVRRYLRDIDVFLSVGDANEAAYRHYGVQDSRIVRTCFPIDVEAYRGAWEAKGTLRREARAALGAQDADVVLSVVGKLVPWKSQGHLLDALERLDGGEPRYVAVFAGTGPEMERLKSRSGRLRRNRAHFAGFVPPSDLPAIYAASDVYVHPAEVEPHSLAISEAIYMGCPVVLSDRCGSWGTADDVRPGKNGFVYPWGEIEALVAAIRRLGSDGALRRNFGEASHSIAVRNQALAHGEGLTGALILAGLL